MNIVNILGPLMQLVIVVGIVVLIVRLVSKRGESRVEGEGTGTSLRRFFVYVIMLVTLLLAGLGVAGLIEAALESSGSAARDTASIARNIAFVVVALPVFVGLAFYTSRRLTDDPAERRSLGWAFYLTVALLGSLIAAMSLVTGFFDELLAEGDISVALAASAVVWTAVWAGHWWVAQHHGSAERLHVHLLLGSAAGLVAVAMGAGVALGVALRELYDQLFVGSVVDSGVDAIVGSLIVFAVGLAVWLWYWFGHALQLSRSAFWLGYVLLLGVLGSVITVISGMGTMLFAAFEWFVADTGDASAATHFDVVPPALAAIAVGGAGWAYHRFVLGDRAARKRTEVDRVYDYLLSGAGLVVAAGGIATLIAVGIDALGAQELASTNDAGIAVASAFTLLLIGVPLWGRYWSIIRRHRGSDEEVELASPTRRIYLYVLFGLSGIVALIDLTVFVYMVLEDLLDGAVGEATLSKIAIPVALLLTTGALAWYHLHVFREDRAEASAPSAVRSALRKVIFVSSDGHGLREALAASTDTRVSTMHSDGDPIHIDSMDQVLEALQHETHAQVVVLETEEHGYEVIPLV